MAYDKLLVSCQADTNFVIVDNAQSKMYPDRDMQSARSVCDQLEMRIAKKGSLQLVLELHTKYRQPLY
jgi:hypothetical protein